MQRIIQVSRGRECYSEAAGFGSNNDGDTGYRFIETR